MREGVQTESQTECREKTGQPEGNNSSQHDARPVGGMLELILARKEKKSLPVSPQGQRTYSEYDQNDSERLMALSW